MIVQRFTSADIDAGLVTKVQRGEKILAVKTPEWPKLAATLGWRTECGHLIADLSTLGQLKTPIGGDEAKAKIRLTWAMRVQYAHRLMDGIEAQQAANG